MQHKSLNQLLCAAMVNGRFREMLLHDPARALSAGYLDHSFALTSEEREMVIGIQAQQLEEFAAQIYHWISGNGNNGHNGNGNGNGHHQVALKLADPALSLRAASLPSTL
jgi:hypothetical protein